MTMDANALFREVTMRICGSLDLGQALHSTYTCLRKLMPLLGVSLGVYDGASRSLRLLVVTSEGFHLDTPFTVPLSEEAKEAGDEILARSREGIRIIPSGATHPLTRDIGRGLAERFEPGHPYRARLEAGYPRTVMLADLILSGERLGQAAFFAEGNDAFTSEHAALIDSVKRPFAIALSNYLRFEQTVRLKDMLAQDRQDLQKDLMRLSGDVVVGADAGLEEPMRLIRRVAPLTTPVLILGETGTGKEVLANALHRLSPRSSGPMISVNCGAISESLLDSELFGHEKGAFTGAVARKRGRFERGHQGTVFLDEAGELSPSAQVRLLRVLQTSTLERVGGAGPVEVDARVVAATHRDLEAMVRRGEFREDLWYRLNVYPVRIPPLRERKQDIPALVRYFVQRKSRTMNLAEVPSLDSSAMDRLTAYDWPGNVRELENVVERALILNPQGPLRFEGLAASSGTAPENAPGALDEGEPARLDEVVAAHIRKVLRSRHGRIEGAFGAARALGLHPSTLKGKMRKLGIRRSDFDPG
jgi:transcriptional regulator with GAF, ATPase, and Fis domain